MQNSRWMGAQAKQAMGARPFPYAADPPHPTLSRRGRGCEKIDLVLFHVYPAKAGIQKSRNRRDGFPGIKYGAGLVKPGMTNIKKFCRWV